MGHRGQQIGLQLHQKENLRDKLGKLERNQVEGLIHYIHWFYQPRQAELTWDREVRKSTVVKSRVPKRSLLSLVLFLIGVARVLENADIRIEREITDYKIRIYS